jgi:hypothetical protein
VIQRVAALALCCIVAAVGMPSLADAPRVGPGDTFTYDVTIQVAESGARAGSKMQNTEPTSGAGTATLQILAVAADGSASGNLSVSLVGFTGNEPIQVTKSVPVTLATNGEIKQSDSIDPLLDQAIALANQSMRDIASRDVHGQPNWQWRLPSTQFPMTVALARSLQGEQVYQGLPTLIVQTSGGGRYAVHTDPVQASLSMAGTDYYDQRDGLFVGQAIRTDSTVSDAASGEHLESSTLVTIVLRSYTKAVQVQSVSTPSAQPSGPQNEQTPTPVPAQIAPSPYPTVPVVTPTPS